MRGAFAMTVLKLPPPVSVPAAPPVRPTRRFATTLIERSIAVAAPVATSEPPAEQRSLALAHGAREATNPSVAPPPDASSHAPASTAKTPAAQANGPTHAVNTALFRHEALRAYALGGRLSTPLSVAPLSTRLILFTLSAALLAALSVACFGHIDLTARGRGVIRSVEGVQPLQFETDGVLGALLVRDGDVVQPGQLLARLDSTRLSASLREAEEQLVAIDRRIAQDGGDAQRRVRQDRSLLERRGRLTHERIESQERSVQALQGERERYIALAGDGLVADRSVRESEASWNQERRALLALQDELTRIEQQSTQLEQTYRAGATQREQELRDARSRRDAATLLLGQTELRAARAGRIESLAVTEGDVLAPGRVVARLVPLAAGRRVTAYVPERERAFVRPGMAVRLELDQFPVGEFGSVAGRVARVSSELANQAEMERTLGAAVPEGVHFAITVDLIEQPNTRSLLARLGSGSLLTVRMPVRQRRIIGLLFDPVRSWLD